MNASGLIATGYHVRNRPDVPSDGSSRERYVDVFDARTGSLVSRLDMEAHAAGTAAWSPDGSVLAVGLHDPRRFTLGANGNRTYIPPEDALRLWRGGLGERLPVQFEDARGGVDRIEISDDNRHVLAVMRYPDGTDGTGVSIWEIATGRRVVSAFPASPGSIGGVFSGQLPNIPVAKFLPGGRHVAWIKHVAVGSSVLEVFRIV